MKITVSALIIGLIACAVVAVGQQSQPNSSSTAIQQPVARGNVRRRTRRPDGHQRVLEQLNLTDAQKQQARSIMQANRESNRAQRQEMRQLNQQWRQGTLTADRLERAKSLRAELRASRQAERTQMMNMLTPEQKAKLQELRQQRRANHESFGRRRTRVK